MPAAPSRDHGLDSLGFEGLVQCHSCAAAVPIAGPATQVTCSACGHDTPLGATMWSAVLGAAARDFEHLGQAVLEPGKRTIAGHTYSWFRGPDRPRCLGCGEPLGRPDRDDAIRCTSCGAARAIEPVPEHVRAACESIVGWVAPPPVEAPTTQTLGIGCSNCAANLETDGSSRVVQCPYCATSNVLPDDVWRALRPAPRRRRFWLVLRLAPDPRRETPDPSRQFRVQLLISAVTGLLLGPLAWLVVAGLMAAITGNPDEPMTPLRLLPWVAGVSVPLALLFMVVWVRRRSLVVPEHEALGRMGERSGTRVVVDILRPDAPKQVVARRTLSLPERIYRRLGGSGGCVQAWVTRDGRHAEVRARPSALV